jgi:hypothetical protein
MSFSLVKRTLQLWNAGFVDEEESEDGFLDRHVGEVFYLYWRGS